jgi:hypothetical protein
MGAQPLLGRPDRLLHSRRQFSAHWRIQRRKVQILGEAVIVEEQLLERRPTLEHQRLGQRWLDREPCQHVAQRVVALDHLRQCPRLCGRLLEAHPQRPPGTHWVARPGLDHLIHAGPAAPRDR